MNSANLQKDVPNKSSVQKNKPGERLKPSISTSTQVPKPLPKDKTVRPPPVQPPRIVQQKVVRPPPRRVFPKPTVHRGNATHKKRARDSSFGKRTSAKGRKRSGRVGSWTDAEDAKLLKLVEKHGPRRWSIIADSISIDRNGKQCRERWYNHLDPSIKRAWWTAEEDRTVIEQHERIGNQWAKISKALKGRPANTVKNHWNSTLKRIIQLEKRKIIETEIRENPKVIMGHVRGIRVFSQQESETYTKPVEKGGRVSGIWNIYKVVSVEIPRYARISGREKVKNQTHHHVRLKFQITICDQDGKVSQNLPKGMKFSSGGKKSGRTSRAVVRPPNVRARSPGTRTKAGRARATKKAPAKKRGRKRKSKTSKSRKIPVDDVSMNNVIGGNVETGLVNAIHRRRRSSARLGKRKIVSHSEPKVPNVRPRTRSQRNVKRMKFGEEEEEENNDEDSEYVDEGIDEDLEEEEEASVDDYEDEEFLVGTKRTRNGKPKKKRGRPRARGRKVKKRGRGRSKGIGRVTRRRKTLPVGPESEEEDTGLPNFAAAMRTPVGFRDLNPGTSSSVITRSQSRLMLLSGNGKVRPFKTPSRNVDEPETPYRVLNYETPMTTSGKKTNIYAPGTLSPIGIGGSSLSFANSPRTPSLTSTPGSPGSGASSGGIRTPNSGLVIFNKALRNHWQRIEEQETPAGGGEGGGNGRNPMFFSPTLTGGLMTVTPPIRRSMSGETPQSFSLLQGDMNINMSTDTPSGSSEFGINMSSAMSMSPMSLLAKVISPPPRQTLSDKKNIFSEEYGKGNELVDVKEMKGRVIFGGKEDELEDEQPPAKKRKIE